MQVLDAKVLYTAGKAYPSKQPNGKPRQSVKLKLSTDKEVSVWFNESDIKHCSLRKGQDVKVVEDGERYTIVFPSSQPQVVVPTESTSDSEVSPASEPAIATKLGEPPFEMKAVIAAGLRFRVDLLRSCHVRIQLAFTTEDGNVTVSESVIQKYAQLLFMDLRDYWQE